MGIYKLSTSEWLNHVASTLSTNVDSVVTIETPFPTGISGLPAVKKFTLLSSMITKPWNQFSHLLQSRAVNSYYFFNVTVSEE